jgi:hypothetical protein
VPGRDAANDALHEIAMGINEGAASAGGDILEDHVLQ